MDAILKVMRKPDGLSSLAGSTLYVSRLTKKGTGLARPCHKCWELMLAVGISEVIYTTVNGTTKEKVS